MPKSLKMAIGMWDPRFTSKNQIDCQIGSNIITSTRISSPRFACDELVPSSPLRVSNAISPDSSLFQPLSDQLNFVPLRTTIDPRSFHVRPDHHCCCTSSLPIPLSNPIRYRQSPYRCCIVLSYGYTDTQSLLLHSDYSSISFCILAHSKSSAVHALERCCTSPANLARARHKHPRSGALLKPSHHCA